MQLNFVVWCPSSACGVSSKYLNYEKHPMVKLLYRFHVYCHVRRVLKRLQVSFPCKSGFNAADNPYSSKGFFKLCKDYEVPHNPISYQNKKFYWTYQQGMKWLDNYIGLDSMTCWIIKKSQGSTEMGLLRIPESVRAHVYLVLNLQASARSRIITKYGECTYCPEGFSE